MGAEIAVGWRRVSFFSRRIRVPRRRGSAFSARHDFQPQRLMDDVVEFGIALRPAHPEARQN